MSTAQEYGLRERKAAAQRLAIARSLRRRLATATLTEISVEDIAADVGISRMTFFNYFPSKDEAAEFLLPLYFCELEAEVVGRGLRGLEAIVTLFDLTGARVQEAPAAAARAYAHYGTRPRRQSLPELTGPEQAQIAPELVAQGWRTRSTGRFFVEELEHARQRLEFEGSTYELAHFLGALWNGGSITGSSPDTDFTHLFGRHVRRALGLPSLADIDPPRVPARYRDGGER